MVVEEVVVNEVDDVEVIVVNEGFGDAAGKSREK